jgi:hypothetical protein
MKEECCRNIDVRRPFVPAGTSTRTPFISVTWGAAFRQMYVKQSQELQSKLSEQDTGRWMRFCDLTPHTTVELMRTNIG